VNNSGSLTASWKTHVLPLNRRYSGRKIAASFGNVTVNGEKDGKGKGEARRRRVCLSMYSITENIYSSRLSSIALLLQPEPKYFTSYNTMKGLGSLSLYAIVLRSSSPPYHLSTCNGQRQWQRRWSWSTHRITDDQCPTLVWYDVTLKRITRKIASYLVLKGHVACSQHFHE
jgi:hypothetical protein